MSDMSKKTIKELEDIIQAGSGADAKTARAAYNEIEKRKGPLDFTVTMILGGRRSENTKAPPKAPPKKPTEKIKKMKLKEGKTKMAYGGMSGGKKHMYVAGGSVTDNPGLLALKGSGAKGMEAYKKITGKDG